MPTVCEIKIELKKQGIKGVTGKNKAELEALLKSGKSDVKPKEKKPDKKPEPKKEPKKPEPKRLEFKKEPEKAPDKAPILSNKSMPELYVKILSLEKRLKDNINSNEKQVTEKTLEKYKTAYRYNRKKFMDSIKNMSKTELKKLVKKIDKELNKTDNKDEQTILQGQMSEINKLI